MRIEEVVLMKAEALFRLGRDAEALATLNQIADARGAIAHTVVNEDEILLERQNRALF